MATRVRREIANQSRRDVVVDGLLRQLTQAGVPSSQRFDPSPEDDDGFPGVCVPTCDNQLCHRERCSF